MDSPSCPHVATIQASYVYREDLGQREGGAVIKPWAVDSTVVALNLSSLPSNSTHVPSEQ